MYQFENIPAEMKTFRAWVVWRYEQVEGRDKPTKVPYHPVTQRKASSTDSFTWSTFDKCLEAYNQFAGNGLDGIGYMLSMNDPYTIIDLDDPKDDPMLINLLMKIVNEFGSYTEVSPSGKGVHIITKAVTQKGRRREPVEVYSSSRFMTMTGNVWFNRPIFECQEMVDQLLSEMGDQAEDLTYAESLNSAQVISDERLYEIASTARNGDRFVELYTMPPNGDNDSADDQALMNFICAYTENREQATRLFMQSARGKRPKVMFRPEYVDWTLTRAFDLKEPPVNVQAIASEIEQVLYELKNVPQPKPAEAVVAQPIPEPMPEHDHYEGDYVPLGDMDIPPPPGLVGEVAQFIFNAVPKPIPQLAVAASIGLLAGIAGRAYNISGTGLNQYLLALAPTGTGKEGIHIGIGKIMNAVIKLNPSAAPFVGPGDIASRPALLKHLNDPLQRSFMWPVGEFGTRMRNMVGQRAAPQLVELRALILELYNRSGHGNVVGKTIYSDKDKNTNSILAPALTILGESTPETFYNILDESLVSDGLMPRFTIIEYLGNTPATNQNHASIWPGEELTRKVSSLCAQAAMLNSANNVINIEYEPEAKAFLDAFDEKTTRVRDDAPELVRQIWSRAHMKALKLAGLIAVGCHAYHPTVSLEAAQWACTLVETDCKRTIRRFTNGEVGSNNEETQQRKAIIDCIKKFYSMTKEQLVKNQIPEPCIDSRIVPKKFIRNGVCRNKVFKEDKAGASRALDRTLDILVEDSVLAVVSPSEKEKLGTRGGKYYVLTEMNVLKHR